MEIESKGLLGTSVASWQRHTSLIHRCSKIAPEELESTLVNEHTKDEDQATRGVTGSLMLPQLPHSDTEAVAVSPCQATETPFG